MPGEREEGPDPVPLLERGGGGGGAVLLLLRLRAVMGRLMCSVGLQVRLIVRSTV